MILYQGLKAIFGGVPLRCCFTAMNAPRTAGKTETEKEVCRNPSKQGRGNEARPPFIHHQTSPQSQLTQSPGHMMT
jgi:hypothetical protein